MGFDDFERLTADDLRAIGDSKWTTHPDLIGSFVAESDFGTAPAVLDAVRWRVERSAFGYASARSTRAVGASFSRFAEERYGWRVPAQAVGVLPELLTGLELVLDNYVRPGAPVILPTPAYMPFFRLVRDHGHEVIEVPLIDGVQLDYAAIDLAFAAGAGLLILVNPSNPSGAVFTRQDLLPLIGIVDAHGGRVFVDEIHAPFIYGDRSAFAPYASINETAAGHAITATSASKGWNIPGLKCSQLILTNPDDLERWPDVSRWATHATSTLGIDATIAAYDDGTAWLDELVSHLDGTRRLLVDLVAEHLPRARFRMPDATYLAWLDLREYRIEANDLAAFFRRAAGVAGTDGRLCGSDYSGFLRLNFATPRAILSETVERMARALS